MRSNGGAIPPPLPRPLRQDAPPPPRPHHQRPRRTHPIRRFLRVHCGDAEGGGVGHDQAGAGAPRRVHRHAGPDHPLQPLRRPDGRLQAMPSSLRELPTLIHLDGTAWPAQDTGARVHRQQGVALPAAHAAQQAGAGACRAARDLWLDAQPDARGERRVQGGLDDPRDPLRPAGHLSPPPRPLPPGCVVPRDGAGGAEQGGGGDGGLFV
mmetsp:Transcript_67641/g.141006  ORF Transcript_67641/g.141006 Transcript_67641/m.141006 type:complete len:209 (+) Transcript_67641:1187-1813(+)